MKKKILLTAMVAICVAILASQTLAFFTAEDEAHNVITTGGVDINLVEKHINEDGLVVDFPTEEEGGISGVMPGVPVSKIVTVENTQAEAWIRIAVTKQVISADGKELPTDVISIKVDEDNWLEKDGFYYYRTPVGTGESTAPLFEEVLLVETTGNEYQGCELRINVYAGAVQTANNGTTVEEVAWPAPEIIE